MFLRMSEDKQSTSEPTVVISTSEASSGKMKSRLTKKHVLIAVSSLLITGLVVTAVLVGIRIFTDSNLEVLKYTLQANGVEQNVSTTENSVIFHITRDNVDAWIVQNFDTGLQVSKVTSDGKTACYVTALNKTAAVNPSAIPTTAPDVKADSPSNSIIYKVLPDPIPDISFLGKKASTMCKNIPTYHTVPDCDEGVENTNADSEQNSTSITDHRSKRGPGWCGYTNWVGSYGTYPCACGCCNRVCSGGFYPPYFYRYWSAGQWWCVFYLRGLYFIQYFGPPSARCWYGGAYYNP